METKRIPEQQVHHLRSLILQHMRRADKRGQKIIADMFNDALSLDTFSTTVDGVTTEARIAALNMVLRLLVPRFPSPVPPETMEELRAARYARIADFTGS